MSQLTGFGEASLVTYIKVTKVDGSEKYYRVQADGATEEIDFDTYLEEGGQ